MLIFFLHVTCNLEIGALAFEWGNTFLFFPLGLLGLRITRRHTKCFLAREVIQLFTVLCTFVGRHETLALLVRSAHPLLVYESWIKIGSKLSGVCVVRKGVENTHLNLKWYKMLNVTLSYPDKFRLQSTRLLRRPQTITLIKRVRNFRLMLFLP